MTSLNTTNAAERRPQFILALTDAPGLSEEC